MYNIDLTATADWEINDVVNEDQILLKDGNHILIRRFKGITIDGYFIVQDFYKDTDIKLTDQYLLNNKESIDIPSIDLMETFPSPLASDYCEYYKSGLKSTEIIYTAQDSFTLKIYFPTGEKCVESHYYKGKREGNFTSWHVNGKKEREGVFQNDKRSGVWITWEMDGKLFAKIEYVDDEIVKELPI